MNSPYFEKVALIEDDPSHAMLISRAIREYTKEIVTAHSLRDALAVLPAALPSIIVSDLHLPDTSGVTFIAELKKAGGGVPLIVLTSSTILQEAVEAMKHGAQDYIIKSFDEHFKEALFLALSRVHAALEIEREGSRLKHQMEVLRLAMESSSDGLAVARPTGELIYANRAFQDFMRRLGGDLNNLLNFDFCHAAKSANLIESFRKHFRQLSPGAVWETEAALSDDKHAAMELSLSVIQAGSRLRSGTTEKLGEAERVIWIRDATEHKRREHFQREILSTTTHDLKGPLGAILISAEMLLGLLKGQGRSAEIALRINSSAQGALNLIEEFLSARRIQEGTFILRPQPYNLGDLLMAVSGNYQTIASAKQIVLKIDLPPGAVEARVDKLGFERVVGNLLSNALKFTGKGGTVWVRLLKFGDEVVIEVQDTGTGMEPSDIKRVFERFTRLERHSEIAGSGLGLFVVKSIVQAHGGKVEVQSKLGEGTTFSIRLPCTPPVNDRGELISLDFA